MPASPPLQLLLALALGAADLADAPAPEVLSQAWFLLEEVDPASGEDPLLAAASAAGRPVGGAIWRRLVEDGGQQVEWELTFPGDELRVLHVERLGAGGPRLVWRELRPQAGRTLTVEWAAEGGSLRILEWGGAQGLRERMEAGSGALLPAYLLELLRRGQVQEGELTVFDPLARSLVPLRLTVAFEGRALAAEQPDARSFALRRVAELRRRDGACAGRYLLEGEDLLAFQWHAGPLRARRVDAAEYERALGVPVASSR